MKITEEVSKGLAPGREPGCGTLFTFQRSNKKTYAAGRIFAKINLLGFITKLRKHHRGTRRKTKPRFHSSSTLITLKHQIRGKPGRRIFTTRP
jgi:hypothetical protein